MRSHNYLEVRVSLDFINLLECIVDIAVDLKRKLSLIPPCSIKHPYHWSYVRNQECVWVMRNPRG